MDVTITLILSLLDQWKAEIGAWCGFKVVQIKGGRQKFADAIELCASRRAEIGLVSYDGLRGHIEDINSVDWELVIADEENANSKPGLTPTST